MIKERTLIGDEEFAAGRQAVHTAAQEQIPGGGAVCRGDLIQKLQTAAVFHCDPYACAGFKFPDDGLVNRWGEGGADGQPHFLGRGAEGIGRRLLTAAGGQKKGPAFAVGPEPEPRAKAVDAFEYLARTEGIIPAIESAHAVAYARKLAPQMGRDQIMVINLSGRGDKDCAAIARYRGEDIYE